MQRVGMRLNVSAYTVAIKVGHWTTPFTWLMGTSFLFIDLWSASKLFYNVLQACVENKDLKLALHLFEEMKTHQLKPNLVSFI